MIVCLVGGGQEINTGEAGISEWIDSLLRKFPGWDVHTAAPYRQRIRRRPGYSQFKRDAAEGGIQGRAAPAVSLRSFRAERVSELVKKVLDLEAGSARILGGLCHASTA